MAGADESIWREFEKVKERIGAYEVALATHLGACEVRHQEVVRRQVEASNDRASLRIDLFHAVSRVEQMLESVLIRIEASSREARDAVEKAEMEARIAVAAAAAESRAQLASVKEWAVRVVLGCSGASLTLLIGLVLRMSGIWK